GSNVGLCSVVLALLIVDGVYLWLASAVTVSIGATVGLINGIVTLLGVPSFIVTLGMLSLLRGIAIVVTASVPVPFPDGLKSSFLSAVNGHLGAFPVQIIWGLAVLGLGMFVLRFTPFGAHIYATGGSLKASRAMGIRAKRVKLICFILTGAACGLVGAMEAA